MAKRRRGVPKRVREDLDHRDLAQRRIGPSWRDRLHWVVDDFARRDLSRLRPKEAIALGYALRGLPRPVGTLTRAPHTPLPVETLRRVNDEVNTGLRRLLAPDSGGLLGGWMLPAPKSVRVVRVGHIFTLLQESRDEAASILAAIAELITRAGEYLRACPECRTPFVRRGRRLFCDEKCSMRVRNRNRGSSR
jgi:hypothetical protein